MNEVDKKTQAEMAVKLTDSVRDLIQNNLIELLEDPAYYKVVMAVAVNVLPALKHSLDFKLIIRDILLDSPEEIRQSILNLQKKEEKGGVIFRNLTPG